MSSPMLQPFFYYQNLVFFRLPLQNLSQKGIFINYMKVERGVEKNGYRFGSSLDWVRNGLAKGHWRLSFKGF